MKTQLLILIAVITIACCPLKAQTFQRTYGGTLSDAAYCTQQTYDGGFIIAGETPEFAPGNLNIYLIKTNSIGDTLWTRALGITAMSLTAKYIQQTTDSGYIICGGIGVFSTSNDMLVIKTNSTGVVVWAKTFGGSGSDKANAVQQTADGGYIITGLLTASAGETGLIKTDAGGNILWSKIFGGPTYFDVATSVKQTSDGGYIVAGTHSLPPVTNIMLTKTDSTGVILWTKIIGGTLSRRCDFVQQTTDSGYVLLGKIYNTSVPTSHDIYLVKTNSAGDTLWTRAYGGSPDNEEGYSIQQTSDGGFIIAGNTRSFGAGQADAYLIKTDAIGNVIWSKAYGGSNYDFALSVNQTGDGGYVAAGNASGIGASTDDVYLVKTDSNGNSGCNETSAATVTTIPQAQVSSATLSLFTGVTATNILGIAGRGATLTTICLSTGINEKAHDDSFIVYPNPSQGLFIAAFSNQVKNGTLVLYNTLGQILFEENIFHESKREINVQNISYGIYFVKAFDGEKSYCKKLVIEQN